MDISRTYSVKSNATRDMRKAIAKGELPAGASVVVVPTGYQIVPPPEAADAAKAVKPPQVPALNGMAPMGFVDAARAVLAGAPVEGTAAIVAPPVQPEVEAIQAARAAEAAKPAAAAPEAPQAAKMDYGLALTSALAKSRAWTEKGLRPGERVGVWVPFAVVHDSLQPHGLSKGQMPASTGSARKRGLIEVAYTDEVGPGGPRKVAIRLTAAGLTAHKGEGNG